MHSMSKNKPNTSMIHEAGELKLRLAVRSSMHQCQGNRVAIGHVVVYYDNLHKYLVQELNVGTVMRLIVGNKIIQTTMNDILVSIYT